MGRYATTAVTLSNRDMRSRIEYKIKALIFDIQCLSGGINGPKRNEKLIAALRKAIESYQAQAARIPDNDGFYVRIDEG